jgi:hypothetical protein
LKFENKSKIKLEAERKNGKLFVPLKTAESSQQSERLSQEAETEQIALNRDWRAARSLKVRF